MTKSHNLKNKKTTDIVIPLYIKREIAEDSLHAGDFARKFAVGYSYDVVKKTPENFILEFSQEFSQGFGRDYASSLARDFSRDFARVFIKDFFNAVYMNSTVFDNRFAGEFGCAFTTNYIPFAEDYPYNFARLFNKDLAEVLSAYYSPQDPKEK
jgi:hypothetical protein